MDVQKLEHVYLPTNGVRLHVVQNGSRYGALVILLHGFPEFWYGWRRQIQPLADAGFRVWAPDQRGYNLSDKPLGTTAYRLDELALDVLGLINAAGVDRCYLVGHDWGGAVAWWLAMRYPERVSKLAILNMPHPVVMLRSLTRNLAQLRRSWYVFFFQVPFLAEALLRNDDWERVELMLYAGSKPGSFTPQDLELYRQAWWRKGAFTSMLNWYRAALQVPPPMTGDTRIHMPVLLQWGGQDIALGRELVQPSLDLCDRGSLVFYEDASHWVQLDEADSVNQHLIEFFSAS